MKGLSLTLGILGAVSMVIGIITAADVIPEFGEAFTWMFWLIIAGVLFLASISVGIVFSTKEE